jgi:hypothetical protein
MSPRDTTSLTARLESSIASLRTAFGQASVVDVERASIDELTRLEGFLSVATKAAGEVVSVRRRISALSAATDPSIIGTQAPLSREIQEATGVTWLVFAVRPSIPGGSPAVRERYRDGWLAFESGSETRRSTPIPVNWDTLTDAQLLALWTSADVAPRRRPSIVRKKLEGDANTAV